MPLSERVSRKQAKSVGSDFFPRMVNPILDLVLTFPLYYRRFGKWVSFLKTNVETVLERSVLTQSHNGTSVLYKI